MEPATAKFQQALPFCVFPVSPQLFALHAVFQSSPFPDSCRSCGSYSSTHVTVVRNRQHSRVITTTCNACGRVHSTPLHKGNSTAFPSRKRKASTFHMTSNPIPDTSLPLLSSNQPFFPSSPTTSSIKPNKPLKNKKSRLYDMLEKNREKERKRAETSSGGLSTFLTTL